MRPGLGRKLGLLGALYFVQGMPFGFQANALGAYLRQSGVSLTAVGLSGALALPWMLKALWAPLVDRTGSPRFGRRKSWIVPLQAGLALTCVAAGLVPHQTHLGLLLGLVLVMNLFAATQDIAVDGLAVQLLGPEELGPGNAAQVVGYKVGMLTGGGLLVWASARVGWGGLFLAMAALCAAVLVATLFFDEPPPRGGPQAPPAFRELWERLLAAARAPGTGWLLAFVATYKLGEAMADRMYAPFLVDHGHSAAQVGAWLGTWGMVASLVGSLGGGLLARRLGLLRGVVVTAFLRVLPLALQWAQAAGLLDTGAATVVAVTCAEHLFGGALTTCMFALMMSKVDPRIGGTHYTLLASVEVAGKSVTGLASGALAQALGYQAVFAAAVAVSLAYPVLALPLRKVDRARA